MLKRHYICPGGCHAFAEMPGICSSPDCSKTGKSFMECKCEDNKHFGILDKQKKSEEKKEEKNDESKKIEEFKPELPQ